MRLVVMLASVISLVLYNEMCQHVEDLYNSVNQYFLMTSTCYKIQNARQTSEKFTGIVSHST